MTEPPAPQVRAVVLDADGVQLSGLLAEPARLPPRAVVVAVHGSGMRAGYFDSRARAGLSLLATGAGLGYTVLSVDRPGYGRSADRLPEGLPLAAQARALDAALTSFSRTNPVGAGFFLVGHSNGGKLVLATAAETEGPGLLGLDVSGVGTRSAVTPDQLPGVAGHGDWRRHWGSLRLYPPDAFRLGRELVSPTPAAEVHEAAAWPLAYPRIAARIQVPVRFTFAEQERWWCFDEEAVAELRRPLAAPRVAVEHQPDAGHNISLGWAARSYHLRVLGFLEECLLARDAAPPGGCPDLIRRPDVPTPCPDPLSRPR